MTKTQTLMGIYSDTVRQLTTGQQHAVKAYEHATALRLAEAVEAAKEAYESDPISWNELWDAVTEPVARINLDDVTDAYEVGCGESARAMAGCVFAARATRSVDNGRLKDARADAVRAARTSPVWRSFARHAGNLCKGI